MYVLHVCLDVCIELYGMFVLHVCMGYLFLYLEVRFPFDLVLILYLCIVWHVCITCMYGIFISIPWSPIPVRSWSSWSWPVKPVWIGKRTGHRHQLWLFTPTSKHVQPSPENRKDNVHGSSIFGGQVVSVLAFYSDDQSSDPRWNLRLFL